jgi:hypothetical protein
MIYDTKYADLVWKTNVESYLKKFLNKEVTLFDFDNNPILHGELNHYKDSWQISADASTFGNSKYADFKVSDIDKIIISKNEIYLKQMNNASLPKKLREMKLSEITPDEAKAGGAEYMKRVIRNLEQIIPNDSEITIYHISFGDDFEYKGKINYSFATNTTSDLTNNKLKKNEKPNLKEPYSNWLRILIKDERGNNEFSIDLWKGIEVKNAVHKSGMIFLNTETVDKIVELVKTAAPFCHMDENVINEIVKLIIKLFSKSLKKESKKLKLSDLIKEDDNSLFGTKVDKEGFPVKPNALLKDFIKTLATEKDKLNLKIYINGKPLDRISFQRDYVDLRSK